MHHEQTGHNDKASYETNLFALSTHDDYLLLETIRVDQGLWREQAGHRERIERAYETAYEVQRASEKERSKERVRLA